MNNLQSAFFVTVAAGMDPSAAHDGVLEGKNSSMFTASESRRLTVPGDMATSALYGRTFVESREVLMKRNEMLQDLLKYVDLPDDWDGDNGHAPTSADIHNAANFMKSMSADAVLSAKTMVAGDGDVGFEWNTEKGSIEAGFRRGNISFYGETRAGAEVSGDEIYRSGIPQTLEEFMQVFFRG